MFCVREGTFDIKMGYITVENWLSSQAPLCQISTVVQRMLSVYLTKAYKCVLRFEKQGNPFPRTYPYPGALLGQNVFFRKIQVQRGDDQGRVPRRRVNNNVGSTSFAHVFVQDTLYTDNRNRVVGCVRNALEASLDTLNPNKEAWIYLTPATWSLLLFCESDKIVPSKNG